MIYAKKLDFQLFYQHGWDSAYFGTSTPSNMALPTGATGPSWNGGFVETHYVWNPQLIFIQRDEFVRMSQQALPTTPGNFGNTNAYTFAVPLLSVHVQPSRLRLSRRVFAHSTAGRVAADALPN